LSNIKQVVILAGGKGTRMRVLTESLPKPMVNIGSEPVIQHLMNIFSFYSNFEFIICSGYKSEIIERYFKGVKNVKVVFTGEDTNTGGRLYNIRDLLEPNFLFTYGDGLANVNINNLIDFHFSQNSIGTLTVSNPTSRFGLVEFDEKYFVNKFIEKPKLEGFVNIGYMVFNIKILDYLNNNSTIEEEPLTRLSEDGELKAFIHKGYFEPMDTYREYVKMNDLWEKGSAPWANLKI
jgi:glucose-1-phosphate cytidylyltransferase|tara:strand:+ start:12299 stop:13003 length:705 start_codon:yes stop_codon:yes gene_type:complete